MPGCDDEKVGSRDLSSSVLSSQHKDGDLEGIAKPHMIMQEKEMGQPRTPSPNADIPVPDQNPSIETRLPVGPPFQKEAERNYKPKTAKFWLIISSAFLATFIVALDRTILSTAIPQITNEFRSLGDIGWYGSAYMLTTAAFQLLFGRIYRFYDLKATLLWSIIVFEVGSAICGAAPSSPVFILGRSIAGLGSAGIMTGSMMVLMPMVPLHKRPMFQSMFGLIFGVSSAVGPLIGGAFTQKATWRWCFYMNLPIGGVVFAALFFFLNLEKKPRPSIPAAKHIMRLDPLGTLLFIPSTVCLILALQLGGSVYPWSDWRLIVLFVFFGLTAIAFGVVQVMMPESASLPVRVITTRTMLAGTGFMVFLAGAQFLCIYYLPLWFQTVKTAAPIKSGVYTLPLVVSMAVASILSSAFIQRVGYYVPSMLLCPCLMAIGEGLLMTLKPNTGSPHWIAFQFLVGFGLGCGMQTVGLAVQVTMPKEDIPTGIAIQFWAQQLGGSVFVSVGQTILNGLLRKRLGGIPGFDVDSIVETGATDILDRVGEEYVGDVTSAYNLACTKIFLAAMILSAAQLLCAFWVPWKSIKKGKPGPQVGPGRVSSG